MHVYLDIDRDRQMGETLNSKCLPALTKIWVFRHHRHKIFASVGPFKRQITVQSTTQSHEDMTKNLLIQTHIKSYHDGPRQKDYS